MKELDLKKYLGRFRNKKVDFFRFPGNYGDSLIWHGTKHLFTELNITENYVEISSPKYNDTLIIDGGGNFVDYYSDVRNFLSKKPNLYDEIIILPHTIFGNNQINILNNLSGKITVFCREIVSAKFLKGKYKKGKVYLWHDCAFYNDLKKCPKGNGILNVFRVDIESKQERLPKHNIDLSYNGYAQKPLNELIRKLSKYSQINTDRLHIAICATLLGKKVKLFNNSYYKNKAVFDYSLRKYTNIKLIEKHD